MEAKRQGKTITQAIKTAIDVFDDVDNKAVVTAMLKEWNNRSSAFYKKYKVVDIEMEIKLHLATIEDGEIYFAGAIDALLEDDQGRLFIGENKTTSDTMDRFTSRLWAQRQGLLYNWALRQMGYPVAGIIYDVIRKPTVKRHLATPPEKRKYKKDGETLYSGQRLTDETQAEYQKRIQAWYADKSDCVSHEVIVHTPAQLQAIEQDLENIINALVFYKHTNNWPRSLSACYAWNRACEFAPYCSAGNDEIILESLYKKRERVFEKLLNRGDSGESNSQK